VRGAHTERFHVSADALSVREHGLDLVSYRVHALYALKLFPDIILMIFGLMTVPLDLQSSRAALPEDDKERAPQRTENRVD